MTPSTPENAPTGLFSRLLRVLFAPNTSSASPPSRPSGPSPDPLAPFPTLDLLPLPTLAQDPVPDMYGQVQRAQAEYDAAVLLKLVKVNNANVTRDYGTHTEDLSTPLTPEDHLTPQEEAHVCSKFGVTFAAAFTDQSR